MQYQLRSSEANRRGFTLIELLVAVGLTMMLMLIFSQIYQMAAGTISTQKGLRRNDQRARTASTILRNDLKNRTFINLVPFFPGQNTSSATGYESGNRLGYFSISENDPNDPTDDVLSFTVAIPEASSQPFYVGRATKTTDDTANHPEWDDGVGNNGTGSSKYAEVVYFLRNGILYRRLLLIRDAYYKTKPLPNKLLNKASYTSTVTDSSGNSTDVSFLHDFDYSAFFGMANNGIGSPFHFHTTESLDNKEESGVNDVYLAGSIGPLSPVPMSLGIPHFRFGGSLLQTNLYPREYITDTNGKHFIGRFLAQETAHKDFHYPAIGFNLNDPYTANLSLKDGDGIVDEYSKGDPQRRGDDILMANVLSFDIKVWDQALGKFMDIGHNGGASGDFHKTKNKRGTSNEWNRFDTWHPYENTVGGTTYDLGSPPFLLGAGKNNLGDATKERPLRAIQITIHFYDVTSDKVRQVTIVQSLRK